MIVTSFAVRLTAFALVLLARSSAACSCFPAGFPTQYYAALKAGTPLSKATVLGSFTPPNPSPNADRFYFLRVTFVYAGCARKTPFVTVARSKVQGSLCGVSLQTGQTYLLAINPNGGTRLVLCGVNLLESSITPAQQKFLDQRDLCCNGKCKCAAAPRVACLVAPCSVTTVTCPGATCVDNYCGGCNAEFFKDDLPACTPDPFA